MSRKKYSKEFKLSVIKEREQGASYYSLERKYNLMLGQVRRCYAAYLKNGESALEKKISNYCCYSADFKKKVVASYLAGEPILIPSFRSYCQRRQFHLQFRHRFLFL